MLRVISKRVSPKELSRVSASLRSRFFATSSPDSAEEPQTSESVRCGNLHDRSCLTGNKERQGIIDRMIRVDHAGEYVAVQIYRGQLDVLKNHESAPVISHMKEQEEDHLRKFEQVVPDYRARPTALLPLGSMVGYALGAGTALLGKEAAMACTVAVETVIAEHYNDQLRELRDKGMEDEVELRETFRTFRDVEEEHHNTALEHDAQLAPAYEPLNQAIQAGCRVAIFLAERI